MSTKQRGRLVRAVAPCTHPGPFGTPVRVSRASLDRWIRGYRTDGFAVLVPVPRAGSPRTPRRAAPREQAFQVGLLPDLDV